MSNDPRENRDFLDREAGFAPEASQVDPNQSQQAPPAAPADRLRQAQQSMAAATAEDQEISLWTGGFSSKAMLGKWILAAVVSIVPPIVMAAMGYWEPIAWWAWAAVAVLVWVWFGLELLYRKLTVKYFLTTQRIVHESGLLKRATNRIEVIDVDDVCFEQGLVERLIGVGTIKVDSSDRSHPHLEMKGIDDVRRVSELLDDTRRKERRRRGLHVEAI